MSFVGTAVNDMVHKQDCLSRYPAAVDEHMRRHVMPNTHRRRQSDETVELRRVSGVNTIRN